MANGNGKNGKGSNGSGRRNPDRNGKSMFAATKTPWKSLPETAVSAPVGRPPLPIDWKVVFKLAMIHCTPAEIAAVMNVNEMTLVQRKEFLGTYRTGWEHGKMSLRRMQWLKVKEGNTQMLVFLGKNILHQRDYWTGELTGKDGGAIEIADATRPKLEKLTLEELKQLESLVQKATPQQIAASEEVIDV